ncbi:TetR/AcrR family transcriptional regulator [Mycolicibacterium sp. XJ870]
MRQRFVQEATRLFAERGYAATSVADIQIACGLTGGSGALYKHFSSKRALLDAVVRQHLDTLTHGASHVAGDSPQDPREFLRIVGEAVLRSIERDRNLIRIIFRDLDAFPDLLGEIWDGVLDNLYRGLTDWVERERNSGRVHVDDPAATVSVLLASLTYYQILDSLIGRAPGGIARDRYLDTWVEHAAASLGI